MGSTFRITIIFDDLSASLPPCLSRYEAQSWAVSPGARATYIGVENPLSFVQVAVIMAVSFAAAEGFRANSSLEKKSYPGECCSRKLIQVQV